MLYVSVTGLRLKSSLHAPVFWWHALRSMAQAKAAVGLVKADARRIDGVNHTLTVWESEEAMRTFLVTGAHLAAMKAFHGIATGYAIGFHAEVVPDWEEVHVIWLRNGKDVIRN